MTNHVVVGMTAEERASLIEQINLLGPWVHGRFDLGHGLFIQPPHPMHEHRLNWMLDTIVAHLRSAGFDRHASQLTLLDVGCNAGFFTMELQRRFGFRKAVGIDPRPRNIRKAQFVQRHLQVPGVDFRIGDVLAEGFTSEPFDVVLFLGVLYHLDDPLLALRALRQITTERLLIETSLLSTEPVRLKTLWPQPRDFELMAIEYEESVNDGSAARTGIVQWPSLGALRMLIGACGVPRSRRVERRPSDRSSDEHRVGGRPSGRGRTP